MINTEPKTISKIISKNQAIRQKVEHIIEKGLPYYREREHNEDELLNVIREIDIADEHDDKYGYRYIIDSVQQVNNYTRDDALKHTWVMVSVYYRDLLKGYYEFKEQEEMR